jgi:hypothetical protein
MLTSACAAAAVSCALASAPALADSQGYIDHWPGNIVVQLNGVTVPTSVTGAPPSLGTALAGSIAGLCGNIRDSLDRASFVSHFDSCAIGSTELRGKLLAPNQLGLKIIVPVSLSVDINAPTNPTINVSAVMEVDATLGFAGGVDGAVASTTDPISVTALNVSFSGANVSSANVLVNVGSVVSGLFGGPTLQTVADAIDGWSGAGSLSGQLAADVATLNASFHGGAARLATAIRTTDPHSNAYFALTVTMDASQDLVIGLQHGPSPATPDCAVGWDWADCSTATDNEGATISFQRYEPYAGWVTVDASTDPIDGLTDSTVSQGTCTSISACPPATSVTHQVCATNLWGGPVCADPVTSLVPPYNPFEGGGGGGASGGSNPPPHGHAHE